MARTSKKATAFNPSDTALLRSLHKQSRPGLRGVLHRKTREELEDLTVEEITIKNEAIYFIIEHGLWDRFDEYLNKPAATVAFA